MAKMKILELPEAPPLPFTVRADLTVYRQRFGILRIVVLVALIILVFFWLGVETTLICLAAVAIILGGGFIGLKSRRIVFTAPMVEYRNWYGRTITLGADDIESVIVFTNFYDANFGQVPRVSIARRTSKSSISMNGLYWPVDRLLSGLAVMDDNGIKAKSFDERVDFFGIRKRLPRHTSFLERNFVKVGFAIAFFGVIVPVTVALIHDAIA